jgi:hypothetical protein
MTFVLEPDINIASACKTLQFFYICAELLDPPWLSLAAAYGAEIRADGKTVCIAVHPTGHDSVSTNDG